jgi:hypothetical protein
MRRDYNRQPLTERQVRPGCKTMKLDRTKVGSKPRFPWQKKKRKSFEDRKKTYDSLVRVGRVSMVQIGEDEFRLPTRTEKRRAKMRPAGAQRNVLVTIAAKRGIAALRSPIQTGPAQARLSRPYTRKAKLTRKAITEHNALVEATYELIRMGALVDRARGGVA